MTDRQFEMWQAQQLENSRWMQKIYELLDELNDNVKAIKEMEEEKKRGVFK